MRQEYLIALGSNRRHRAHGAPPRVVAAAMAAMAQLGEITARSPIIATAPLGAARRRFANAALVLRCEASPPALLDALKRMERSFGRRPGRRWGDRVLDCDIVLWSGGRWESRSLAIPHPAWKARDFVMQPAWAVAPRWRDPASGLRVAHLHARLTRRRPLPR